MTYCLTNNPQLSALLSFDPSSFFFLSLLKDLKLKLEEKKQTLEETEEICHKLTEQNKEEPLIVADFKDKLDKVKTPFEKLKAKITELEGRLQAAQIRSQEFSVSFREFTDKLQGMEEVAANLQPVSAVFEKLQQQKTDDEVNVMSTL